MPALFLNPNNNRGSLLSFTLFLSALFFVFAAVVAGFLFFGGTNIVSSKNIEITSSGPVSVAGGEEFNLLINIVNKNNLDIKYANLNVEYPKGVSSTIGGEKSRYRKYLGDMKSGQILNETVKAVVFGEEGSEKEIKINLEYRTENSNAIFVKEEKYKLVVGSSPVVIELKMPDRANNNQELEFSVKVSANTPESVKDLVVSVDYPSGFVFSGASPEPFYGESLWKIGTLSLKKSREIKIKGVIKGQNDEEKFFKVIAGTLASKDSNQIDVAYNSSSKSLVLSKPSVDLDIVLNGSEKEVYVARSGDLVRVDIKWTNNLQNRIINPEIVAKINGEALNRTSVSSQSGFFKSVDNSIVWNKNNGALPQSMESGDTGRLSFSFSIANLTSRFSENPEINIDVNFKGARSLEDGGGEVLDLSASRKIKISSNLQLAARAVYYAGPFKNSGPLPPVREQETTYTVIWSVVNTLNDASSVTVKATLPSYVRWLGQVSPSSESVTYNSLGGEIIWNVGDVSSRSGVISPAREVAFQVGFVPSISQVGERPMLISDATVSGVDAFTDEVLNFVRRAQNIEITNDPSIKPTENGPVR